MNPVQRLSIDNFEEIVEEIDSTRGYAYLPHLERKFVDSVVTMIQELPAPVAKKKLNRIKKFLKEQKLRFVRQPLCAAFVNASEGAVTAALSCL